MCIKNSLYHEFSVKYCYKYEQLYINLQPKLHFFCSFMSHYQDFCRPVLEKGKLYSGFKVLLYSYSLYHEFSVKYC
jgi:hypothetical protein